MKRPPSIDIVCPVIYCASSLAKNDTAFVISSTIPNLFKGIVFIILFLASLFKNEVISVSMNPGAIELTVMPLEPNSFASDFVKPPKPSFAYA